jgi:excisionase family DNA binding protein
MNRSDGESVQLLELKEVAAQLGVSSWTVRRMVDSGHLAVVRLPCGASSVRRLLFDEADVRRLIQASKEREG